VERELSTLPDHLSSPPVFCGVRSFMCMFCRSFIVLFLFGIVFFDLWILITPLVSSNSSSYMYEPYDENTLWRLLRVSISRLLLRFSLTNSNITSLFRFVTKRTIYRLGIISTIKDLQNIHIKLRTPQKTGGELRCSGRVDSSRSTSGTRTVLI
jgi:hypothetical protein